MLFEFQRFIQEKYSVLYDIFFLLQGRGKARDTTNRLLKKSDIMLEIVIPAKAGIH
jgi:hypothetical protein